MTLVTLEHKRQLQREATRRYRARNIERIRAERKAHYAAHPEKYRFYFKKYEGTHKEQRRERRQDIKRQVLEHYGPEKTLRCNWPDCEITDIDMLSLDHINNNGAEERRQVTFKGGVSFYCHLRKLNYPTGYQTLCMNHQMKKHILNLRGDLRA